MALKFGVPIPDEHVTHGGLSVLDCVTALVVSWIEKIISYTVCIMLFLNEAVSVERLKRFFLKKFMQT